MRAVLDSTILVSAFFTPFGPSDEILTLARADLLSLPRYKSIDIVAPEPFVSILRRKQGS
jgi:predicted nucleic acid-binding protein